ncbi:hypothetical protein CERZMDRAFT_116690 [Cercospora zeae-maydis SCOH1-5]|uniref:Uncharacterized protein n=1 Tax=Cercospora zeae-maydis SCOH1-5 TaxID=717836 RepID=A0A6A6FP49_9PEZI|nr:hypothetical protein CERZMDRAFT_116690 [Cercospora zeae-maydis SCOH1-5]
MRFTRRGSQQIRPSNNLNDADIVIQIGTAKTGLRTPQLVGTNVRSLRSSKSAAVLRGHSDFTTAAFNDDEGKAVEIFTRMQDSSSSMRPGPTPCGPWNPYSPDDAYPYARQPKLPHPTANDVNLPFSRRVSSAAAARPVYAIPALYPYHTSQPSGASVTGRMPFRTPILDNVADPPSLHRLPSAPDLGDDRHQRATRVRRSSTKAKTTSRPRDLVHLLPRPKASAPPLPLPPRHSQFPSDMTDFHFSNASDRKLKMLKTPTSSRPSTSATTSRSARPFDEAILDQHKTNVRRPPKGIQNWFDAYLDDDDDDDDELDDDVEKPEPHELPGDDVLPPAYSGPHQHMSRASDKHASEPRTPHDSHHPPPQSVESALERARLHCESWSSRSDSIQSSHLGNWQHNNQGRLAASTLDQESILSLTDSEFEEDDDEEETDDYDSETEDGRRARGNLPAIRDSIYDDRNIMIASASALDVVRVSRPTQLHEARISRQEDTRRSSARSLSSSPEVHRRDAPPPLPPQSKRRPSYQVTADPIALRRLNGLSLESACTTGTTETSNTGLTCETRSSGTSYQDPTSASSQDNLHMVAITEEEKLVLELMRQKRVAMQQMSFTEGYQLALRTEQQRLAKRTATAEERAVEHLKMKKESVEQNRTSKLSASSQTPTQETDWRRQLSAIRKEQVDHRFQMERFLDMSRPPAPLSSHPPSPREQRKPRAPSGEVLPATRYSPATSTQPTYYAAGQPGYFSADDCDTESVRQRVKQFISSKGAVPPFDSGMKTMRRPTGRQLSSTAPSPVIEGIQSIVPPLPPRSPERNMCHSRSGSHFTVSTLTHKPSCSSLLDDPRDRSPVSCFSGRHYSRRCHSPQALAADLAQHDTVFLPPRPYASELEREFSESTSHPQLTSRDPPHHFITAASPFAGLITAASRVTVEDQAISPKTSQYDWHRTASTTDIRPASAHGGVQKIQIIKSEHALGKQRSRGALPRLNTVDSVLDARTSTVGITSPGEEVLSAWAELGGGQGCLQTKVRGRIH